ncbi:efflux RND transporter periplasmic adaptor subunit [Echinicola marina]|uniref:efflux RND transporter periplasmic adaptor subunit n=1 Tax=Echinicola marina TaxID=2859768 RepID=UPI001CF689A8|nr:efflux RND transporter periplasmic adaptor subunit [Echinicola marina]UCS91526.1 efflux RND transporter periplasmic adaptor subunit [Echinicola marina]
MKNKNIYIIVVISLIVGALMGWWANSGGGKNQEKEHAHETGSIYTCSMHPQIRQDEPGDCPICGMELIPLSALEGNGESISQPTVLKMSPEAVALANISTSRVKAGSDGYTLELSGKIDADERKVASVSANFSGRVDELYVAFTGQEVKKGQKLARIYSPELIAAHRELIEAKKSQDISPALYEAAKQKLKQWELTDEQINKMEHQVDYQVHFDIYANTAGVVDKRNVSVGDYVEKGTVLFEITNLSKVWVILDAYERNINNIQLGDQLSFSANSRPDKEYNAKVTFIDPNLNANTRSIKVRAEVNNTHGELKPGMFVTSKIKVTAPQSSAGLMIPSTAVLWTGKRSVVYREVGNEDSPAFEMVEVSLGATSGEMQLVKDGLNIGDKVVTNGVFAVDGAAQLSGKYSMMNQKASRKVEVSPEFAEKLEDAIDVYFILKNKLVLDKSAKQEALRLKQEIERVGEGNVPPEVLDRWTSEKKEIQVALDQIIAANEIGAERDGFIHLSEAFIAVLEDFGTTRDVIYKSYCPMAKNDQGAFWLSEVASIKNPYFGSAMLSCGEVKGEYRKSNN